MVKGVKFLSLLLNASCSDVITVPLFFSLAPKPPLPLSSFDTHARWQTVTQSARSRWSYEKIEALNSLQFTVDPRQYALDKNLHSKSIYFLKLTHQERVMEVQWFLKRTHSRPQSPSFLGHVVLKRGALEAVVAKCPKISNIRSRMCRSYKYHCSWS